MNVIIFEYLWASLNFTLFFKNEKKKLKGPAHIGGKETVNGPTILI